MHVSSCKHACFTTGSFKDYCQHPELLRLYAKTLIEEGDRYGRPVLTSSDVLVWKKYSAGDKKNRPTMQSPRTHNAHNYLPFVRSVSHNYAINELRNLGSFPVRVEATETTPVFSNFNQVIYGLGSRLLCPH